MAGARPPAATHAAPLLAKNYADVSWTSRLFFSYVNPILNLAGIRPLEENDVEWLTPTSDEAHTLAANFQRMYEQVKAHYAAPPRGGTGSQPARRPWTTLTGITLLRLYWWPMVLESIWVLVEVGQRLGTPVALRQFLRWLQSYAAAESPPQWQGWVWAVVLGACGYSMVIIHHQLFWIGMRTGFSMRQQAVSAIHAKVLRLNSAAVGALSSGHVVNLVSNDVRRFDDVMPFWIFLWAAPLELAMVLLMVSLELDFVSALAGVATSLAMIPLQSALVRYIGGLRRNTARCTDERVRLAGEVVEGALAMKMLSWEDPFADALRAIRARETYFSRRMQRIRGVNFAMQFCITPIVAFVTFAVYRARNGSLKVASVFYSLSLLHLPKLYMVNFFVLAVQTLTELRVSLQRIDAFLSTPEPPRPGQHHHQHHRDNDVERAVDGGGSGAEPRVTSTANGGLNGGAIRRSVEMVLGGSAGGGRRSPEVEEVAATGPAAALPVGYVALRGADYDWARPFGRDDVLLHDTHGTALGGGGGGGGGTGAKEKGKGKGSASLTSSAATSAATSGAAAAGGGGGGGGLTLYGIRFSAAPGELLGICGAVGSGKSSLLAALLGELQPLRGRGGEQQRQGEGEEEEETAGGASAGPAVGPVDGGGGGGGGRGDSGDCGPIVRGRVAYCAQVPWIVAGSVRENIVFGSPWDEQWYGHVVYACCLADDLAGLPAGDQTELGERGINLSGGQKARVALARACYARPAVALLDDPLSAVDPRVGRDLFSRAIGPGGLLAQCGTTRLLVTHQRQYLPKCDRVLVLRGGRLQAAAPWPQVAALRLPELTAGHGGMGGGGEGAAAAGGGVEAVEATVDEALDEMAAEAAADPHARVVVEVQRGEEAPGAPAHGADGPAAAAAEAADAVAAAAAAAGVDGSESSAPGSADATLELRGEAEDGGGDLTRQQQQQQPRAAGGSGDPPGEVVLGLAVGSEVRGKGLTIDGDGDGDEGEGEGGIGAAVSRFWRVKSVGPSGLAERYRLSLTRSFAAAGRVSLRWGSSARRLPGGGSTGATGGEEEADSKSASLQKADAGKLVQSEDRVTGTVSWRVYASYCRHLGLLATALIWAAMFAGQAVFLASEWWLALWSRSQPDDQARVTWLWVYGMLTGIVIVLAFLRSATFFEATLSAATSIHNAMARRVLRAPLSFFHTNPSGRIVNRFSKDQGQVDDLLPSCLFDALQSAFQVFGAFVLVAIAVPVILPVFLPLAVAFLWIRSRYITASRDIKRWEAVSRSPVFASFSATLKGLPTIRAYGAAERFDDAFLRLMAHNGNWYFAFISTARWIGVRLDAVAGTTLLAAALLAMAMRDQINTGVMALALTHVLQLTGLMQWVVRQTAEVENTMTSVERMLAYTELPSEPPRVAEGGQAPPPGWPRSGALTYEGVTAVYRPGLPPVLRDLSFSLAPGTSCGVVGRTGSGKSSLMLTLFRLIDVTHGSIQLDGLDTARLGLDALRRQLAIIPQDPVLFSGTLRSNLDPWRTHDDGALWAVLEAVQLRGAVAAMPGGLDGAMAECGGNLSVGQRQLFCLARALLQDAKVLALDEATANVDRATDQLIQNALRDFAHRDRESHGRVLLVIAHRIDTIMDTDQLLVLSAGQLVESGPPARLAEGDGVFARMVAAARLAQGAAPPGAGKGS
ncbi:hypothetical protein PLESTB_000360400 [Pleodorina starrii]|uniref:Uncharacterized protein n=1 Tax=Pleodorina starrii TaxID=330485 RepID=A0A9W6EZ57_9CHLO|nr:hypothetical protein PLESTM_000034800 [Pleodorina starrii]GLC50264.1 hypothetical protein PLESTB_000360400 [Pleodorina starrii]GLC64352.1 hypothetical protein PLESTF_000152200 [Pleodorina starrii]